MSTRRRPRRPAVQDAAGRTLHRPVTEEPYRLRPTGPGPPHPLPRPGRALADP